MFRIGIRIHRIHMFLGLVDPEPLDRGMDPDPDPSIIKQKQEKNLDFYSFVFKLWLLFDFLSLKNYVKVSSKSTMQKNFLKKSFFVGIMNINDENRRIRIH